MSKPIYIGMKGRVMAVDRQTGKAVWETHLSGSGMVNLVWDEGLLFAHTKGELYCVEPSAGRVLWKNDLPGMGYGMGTLASPTMTGGGDQQALVRKVIEDQQRAAAAGAAG